MKDGAQVNASDLLLHSSNPSGVIGALYKGELSSWRDHAHQGTCLQERVPMVCSRAQGGGTCRTQGFVSLPSRCRVFTSCIWTVYPASACLSNSAPESLIGTQRSAFLLLTQLWGLWLTLRLHQSSYLIKIVCRYLTGTQLYCLIWSLHHYSESSNDQSRTIFHLLENEAIKRGPDWTHPTTHLRLTKVKVRWNCTSLYWADVSQSNFPSQ